MNAKCKRTLTVRGLTFFALALGAILWAAPEVTRAQSADKFYFWVDSYVLQPASGPQSFVIEVDGTAKAQIDAIFANGGSPGLASRIAAGAVPYNRNYYAPGQPAWNWYVVSIDEIFDLRSRMFPAVVSPRYDANPSDIAVNPAQWIADNGNSYVPRNYSIRQQVDPAKRDAVANVSNRGMTGAGEKTVITGLIVKGGVPRNIVVRALGPSLTAAGAQQVAANPKIEVYSPSGRRIAANADWRTDSRSGTLSQAYPALAPANEKEAALLLTLIPGAYTLHGLNEDGTEGVVLLEAYDVDSNNE